EKIDDTAALTAIVARPGEGAVDRVRPRLDRYAVVRNREDAELQARVTIERDRRIIACDRAVVVRQGAAGIEFECLCSLVVVDVDVERHADGAAERTRMRARLLEMDRAGAIPGL